MNNNFRREYLNRVHTDLENQGKSGKWQFVRESIYNMTRVKEINSCQHESQGFWHIIIIMCSAQGQVLHCKLRHQGCNSAQKQVFHCKLRNLGCSSNLKRSEKIPGAPTRRWGEWISLTGPSRLHRNSPQGLNISSIRVFDQIRDLEILITLRPHFDM